MKFLTALFCVMSLAAFAQPKFGIEKKDSCYKRGEAKSKQRFAEWECGKIAGVVDCNEKLELDPGSNTVITTGNKQPFSGMCETCHMNGILERRVTFVNGKTNGIDTTNYKSGCPMVIRSHIQGVENGKWTYFNDSTGIPAWEKNYSMGQLHGSQVTFSRKGDTLRWENYNNGVLQGPKVTYNVKGIRTKQVTYVNGLLEGPFLVYNGEGKIIEETSYKEGRKNGVFRYYYDDGVLLRTENWLNGQKNGEFKMLYYDQSLQSMEIYKKDLKEGWFEERFPNGKSRRRAFYKKDVLIEEHVFDEQGTEIKTFGGQASNGKEDDEMPAKGDKKKKEKKPKKEKKKKGE